MAGGKRRFRVVKWITDEAGQRIESWRTRVGNCYRCGKPAYWEVEARIDSGELRMVKLCKTHRMRAWRTGQLDNLGRNLRDSDVQFGEKEIAKAHKCGEEITCAEVARRINERRKAAGLEEVRLRVVMRRVCYHLDSYDEGYTQEQ